MVVSTGSHADSHWAKSGSVRCKSHSIAPKEPGHKGSDHWSKCLVEIVSYHISG